MVEMRWYTHPSVHIGGNEFAAGIRVLQYRVQRERTPPSMFETQVYESWSEWMDVPEVSAE